MSKTTITLPEKNESSFPLYAKEKHQKGIVLFTSENKGTVISKGESMVYEVGDHHNNWESCFDKKWWKILPKGTVITTTI